MLEVPGLALTHYEVMKHVVRETQPKSYLEVGVQEGGSLRAVLEVHPRTIRRLVLCDTWGSVHGGTNRGSHEHIEEMLVQLKFGGFVQWFDAPSSDMWRDLTAHCDLVLIDADHSEECTYEDLTAGWKLCDKALVQHDIEFPEVNAALMRFLAEHSEVSIVRFTGDTGTAVMVRSTK